MEELNLNPLGLDFSLSGLLAGFVFGIVGLYIFRHGKKTANYSLIFVSVLLMSYTVFTRDWWQHWGVGAVLCGFAYYINKNGGDKTG